MITKDEGQLFLGMVSDVGNENSISLQGKYRSLRMNIFFIEYFRIFKSNA